MAGPAHSRQEPAVSGDHVERLDRVGHGALRGGGGLDPAAGKGAARGDPGELGHNGRDQPPGQGGRGELVLRGPGLHVQEPPLRVDGDHPGEPRDVDSRGLFLVERGQGAVGVGDTADGAAQRDLVARGTCFQEASVVPADALHVLRVLRPALEDGARGPARRQGVVGDEAPPRDSSEESQPDRGADPPSGDREGGDHGEGRDGDRGLSSALFRER